MGTYGSNSMILESKKSDLVIMITNISVQPPSKSSSKEQWEFSFPYFPVHDSWSQIKINKRNITRSYDIEWITNFSL